MGFLIPERTLASTKAEHMSDHTVLAYLGSQETWPDTVGPDYHLVAHNLLHPDFSLPQRDLSSTAAQHLADHEAMHAAAVTTYAGIRGPHGPQSDTGNITDWPGSFDATIGSGGTYSSIAEAASLGTANQKFLILPGTYVSPATAVAKTGQEFWGHGDGVILDGTALTTHMIWDGFANVPNVKIGNITLKGFRATVECTQSPGWVVEYCDFSLENGISGSTCVRSYGQTVTPATFIHHSTFHHTGNPINAQNSTSGVRVEDCDFYQNVPGSGDSGHFKLTLGSKNHIFRHNWIHDISATNDLLGSRGFWYDYHNYNCLAEQNLVHGPNVGMGIEFEANPGELNGGDGGNICRYNYIHDCNNMGIFVAGSSYMEIYGNYLSKNQTMESPGLPQAEIVLMVNNEHVIGQTSDLIENIMRNNYIEANEQGGVPYYHAKRGAALLIMGGTSLPPDPAKYVSNTANNQWYDNKYKFNTSLSYGYIQSWSDITGKGVGKSWYTWLALPQDSGSQAEV